MNSIFGWYLHRVHVFHIIGIHKAPRLPNMLNANDVDMTKAMFFYEKSLQKLG